MKKILIVEDDNHINNMLKQLLELNGYETIQAFSGTEAIIHTNDNKADLILLDLMLPGKSGNEVLEEISLTNNVPIIVITAIDAKDSIIEILKLGANDYITKPFDNEELLARIEVQFRNINKNFINNNQELVYKDLKLNTDNYEVYIKNKQLMFSKREFEILRLLIEHPSKVFSKSNIYKSIWKEDVYIDDNTINVHISKIRSKLLAANPGEEYIQTVWGIGFKLF